MYRPCIASTIRMCIYLVNYYKCSFLSCWLCSVYCLRSEESKGFFYSLIVEKVRFFSADVLLATSWSSHHEFRKKKDRLLCSARRPPLRPHYSFRKQTRREGEKGSLANTLPWSHRKGGKLFFPSGDQSPFTARERICRFSTRGEFIYAANSHVRASPLQFGKWEIGKRWHVITLARIEGFLPSRSFSSFVELSCLAAFQPLGVR